MAQSAVAARARRNRRIALPSSSVRAPYLVPATGSNGALATASGAGGMRAGETARRRLRGLLDRHRRAPGRDALRDHLPDARQGELGGARAALDDLIGAV